MLSLRMVDLVGDSGWRWLLTDDDTGAALADHTVALDPAAPELEAFADLYGYLRRNAVPDRRVAGEISLVSSVGAWIGREVLGPRVGRAIVDAAPVTVRVEVPSSAGFMMFRPLELAHVDGVPLASRAEVTLVFDVGGSAVPKPPVADRLRMLAVFSLPTRTTALALRRERYELSRLIRRIAARSRRVVELRVLQYGVTRSRLAKVVESEDGWDLLHLSGHGRAGEFLLELTDGSPDPVSTSELVRLLRPTRRRVRLAVVSACQSAAATTAETLRWLRLNEQAEELEEQASREADPLLTAIAPELVRQLDCAVVAMRYPVTDDFAIDLADGLYERLLGSRQRLDTALCRAVAEAAGPSPTAARPALSLATPAVFGARAAGLSLEPPPGEPLLDPGQERMASFPPEPERFVGRAQAMAEASAALAPGSDRMMVVLHGMAGAGKTACALELAYRHQDSFAALAFWQAPERDEDFGGALAGLALALEKQLAGFTMIDKIGTVERLEAFLPRLRTLMERTGLLLVLDNLETLLTPNGTWRDPRWAPLMTALTDHRGESRVVATSRVPLAAEHTLVLPVHALSRDEAAALARELPNLRALLHADGSPLRGDSEVRDDRELVRRVLNVVQGHPKLLELADAAAQDPERLQARLTATEHEDGRLTAFLRQGDSDLDSARFFDVLAGWTHSTLATLPEHAVLLLRMLCCLEDNDRWSYVVEAGWADLWRRLDRPEDAPDPAAGLDVLARAALIHPTRTGGDLALVRYRLHPGIAETVRATTEPGIRTAVDAALAGCWSTTAQVALRQEGTEASQAIVHAGLAAAPYLIRRQDWNTASTLLEDVMHRDGSPRTLQVVLPYLRKISDITHSPDARGVLARALSGSDPAQAQQLMRDTLRQALDDGRYRLASTAAGYLTNLLYSAGRFQDALAMTEEHASYTQQARLGPWTRLTVQGQRLRILGALGEHRQVLAEIARLRQTMDRLSERPGDDETASPWNTRETILDIGRSSALALGRWQECLTLSADSLTSKRQRNAGATDIAGACFNDFQPLLELGRWDEAEKTALAYQRISEQNNDIIRLSAAFAARASIEARRGRADAAISFGRTALRYAYTQPEPRHIANCHHNLANDLRSAGADRLAAALIFRLTGMAHNLETTIHSLARELAEGTPPTTLQQVIEGAEQTEGVRLGALLASLATEEEAEEALAEILRTASGGR